MHLILPDEYKKALAFVKAKCPEAVIAGGCLRDLHTGKEVKDIDIFVIAQLGDAPELFGGEAVSSEEFDDYDGQGDIHYVENIELDGVEYPVQIIHLYQDERLDADFLKRAVERVDLGFCQVGFDGLTFYSTDLYVDDMKNKTIHVNPDNPKWNRSATERRLERLVGAWWCSADWRKENEAGLLAKYWDWTVIDG